MTQMELVKRAPEEWDELVAYCSLLIRNMAPRKNLSVDAAQDIYDRVEALPNQSVRERCRSYSLGLLACNSAQLLSQQDYAAATIDRASDALVAYVQSTESPLRVRHISAINFPTGVTHIALDSFNMLKGGEGLLADVLLCVSYDQSKRRLPEYQSKEKVEALRAHSITEIQRKGAAARGFRIPIFGAVSRLFREWLLLQPEITDRNSLITIDDERIRSSSGALSSPARKIATIRIDELESAPLGSLLRVNEDGTLDANLDWLPTEPQPVVDPLKSFHDERLSCSALPVRNVLRQASEPIGAIDQSLNLLPEIVIEARRKL